MAQKNRIRLLLVDENQLDRSTCIRVLTKYDDCEFVVFEAATGAQGLKLATEKQPDCILLDQNLLDANGVQFLSVLKQSCREMALPLVILTGSDTTLLPSEVSKLGVCDYFVKDREREAFCCLPSRVMRALHQCQLLHEKALAAEKLQAAKAQYRALEGELSAITYIVSLKNPGKLLYLSPQIQQLGIPSKQWLATTDSLLKWVHADDRSTVIEAFTQTYAHMTPLLCKHRLVKHDGQIRWFLNTAEVVKDEAGKPLFLEGELTDITEYTEAEQEFAYYQHHLEELVAQRTEELKKQNEVLSAANINLGNMLSALKKAEAELQIAAAAFESQSSIIVADRDKVILRVNRAFSRVTGYDAKDAIGQKPFFLRSGLHDPVFYEQLWARVAREGYWEGEIWNKRKNGALFPAWQTITKVSDHEGHVTHYVGSLIDITAQKHAEKILLDARVNLESQVAHTQEELEQIKQETQTVNTTLNVLLKHQDQFKDDANTALLLQIEETLLPLLRSLKGQSNGRMQSIRLIDILESNLQQLMETYGHAKKLDALYRRLTPHEIQVASMVKQGLATKVIAAALNISASTVEIHRKHIRKKLGLDAKTNLHSYLLSLTELS